MKRKMKTAATYEAAWFSAGKPHTTAMTIMQTDMPVALTTKSVRRPKRSTAAKAIKEQRNFQVRDVAARILGRSPWRCRLLLKIVVV